MRKIIFASDRKKYTVERTAKKILAIQYGGVVFKDRIESVLDANVEILDDGDKISFTNCIDNAFEDDTVYWEHPLKQSNLIARYKYKDYLIREMMSEIFEYVSENMALENFVMGLVKKSDAKGSADVKTEDLNIGAKLSLNLESGYVYKVEDVQKADRSCREFFWLRAFPNIVSAVERGAGTMEYVEQIDIEASFGLNAAEKLKVGFGLNRELSFYIYFKKK